jgi:hypothetical protein
MTTEFAGPGSVGVRRSEPLGFASGPRSAGSLDGPPEPGSGTRRPGGPYPRAAKAAGRTLSVSAPALSMSAGACSPIAVRRRGGACVHESVRGRSPTAGCSEAGLLLCATEGAGDFF